MVFFAPGPHATVTNGLLATWVRAKQPAAKSDGWNTDPFTLTGRDGYFYARGSSDHKVRS